MTKLYTEPDSPFLFVASRSEVIFWPPEP